VNVLRRGTPVDAGAPLVADGLALPAFGRAPWPRFAIATAALVAAIVLGVAIGPAGIPLDATARILLSKLPGVEMADSLPAVWRDIIWEVRLPRVLLAGLAGAVLAMSGATYQGVFRNPLADPYLIGVATGAALGSTIVIVAGAPHSWHGLSLLPLAAFAGAITAVAVVYSVARVGSTVPTTTMILAGAAVASFTTAITSFLMLRSTSHTLSVFSVVLGSFNTATWGDLTWTLPYALPAAAVILAHGRVLNVLSLDEEQARQLGVHPERAKLLLLGAASLAAAAAVSVAGTIGFVGLIVPHAVRMLWGSDNRHLLPMSILCGATFLILADLIARSVDSPSEVPVGIVTAVCGVPFFLYLLRRARLGAFW
jgi:iron complex transport system permease protein